MTYKGRDVSIDIGKTRNNFDKDGRPKCFNCNIYKHIAKDCRKPKKEQDARKCYKYEKIEHITRNCKLGQRMKNQGVQEEPDIENRDKEQGFGDDPE